MSLVMPIFVRGGEGSGFIEFPLGSEKESLQILDLQR